MFNRSQPHPATRPELMAYLSSLGIQTTTIEHEAVFTVAESEVLARTIAGGHTKNLFLKDAKGALFLIVAEAHTPIDLKHLHKILDCGRFSFGKPELLEEVLGVSPGSVTAFALLNDRPPQVTVVFDTALMTHQVIICHPLVNTASTAIARDDLLQFIAASGHAPRIVKLSAD